MNIHEIGQKIKGSGAGEKIVLITLVILGILGSFALGRISVLPEHKNIPYVNIWTGNSKSVVCNQGNGIL